MYYIARRVGLTKRELGVTWHGLRHEWAIRQLENLAGVKAPVRGGMAINYRELSDVRRKISEGMGHSRSKITNAYYGSYLTLEREQTKRFNASWKRSELAIEAVGSELQKNGINNLYWIGNRALGLNQTDSERFEYVMPPDTNPVTGLELASKMAGLMTKLTGVDCVVYQWESLSQERQEVWHESAIPLFEAVAPLDLMKQRLQRQRLARMSQVKTE